MGAGAHLRYFPQCDEQICLILPADLKVKLCINIVFIHGNLPHLCKATFCPQPSNSLSRG